jgi:formylglycine-generating enzyme required for sulfatase activity
MESSLRAELSHARRQTDLLFHLIAPETLYERPVAERHRLIFYLGHFEAFDWNVLARRSKGENAFHPVFDSLFERGIDPAPDQAPADTPGDWPHLEEVAAYNAKTRAWIDRHFAELQPALIQMAIEHRHMHAETFAYLLHNLPADKKRATVEPARNSCSTPANPMVSIAAGAVTLGKSAEDFAWDNEYLAHEVFVPAFRISKLKISNGEYLEFVREGGREPHFWMREGDRWMYRGMFATTPLPLDAPAWVTLKQAAAYAEWRGFSLPTEGQWQRAASFTDSPDPVRDNFGYNRWDPIAVDAASNGHGNGAPAQMIGNGWEWTRDIFAPFQGFDPHPYYPGYSADFFDGQHYVMKGASPRTAQLLTRPTFRNWFRPDYPYMYAGFRLVENGAE